MKILPLQSRRAQPTSQEVVYRVLLSNLGALYSTAYRLTRRADLAEDVTQETARKALQGASALRDERNVRAWIFQILMNTLRDHRRRRQQWQEVEPEREECETAPDPQSLRLAAEQDVWAAVDRLVPERQAIVILVDIEEFTIAETASILGIPPSTAASSLARAHRELRGLLEAYRFGAYRRGEQP